LSDSNNYIINQSIDYKSMLWTLPIKWSGRHLWLSRLARWWLFRFSPG